MDRLDCVESRAEHESKDLSFIMVLGVLALFSLVIVFYLYRYHFSGGFSLEPSDWSNFGGYFGGVLVPIVSVLTLATVFKTVLLQREMIKLQDQTFRSQIAQANLLASDAMQSRLDYRKSVLMGVVDKVGVAITNEIYSTQKACFEAIKVMSSMTDTVQVQSLAQGVQKLQVQIGQLDNMRVALQQLMFNLSMKTYASIDELDREFRERMGMIRPDFGEPPQ